MARRPRKSVTTRRCRDGWIDRQVDGIAAGSADESRERTADEEEERHHVRRVAHPSGDEAMERHGTRPVTSATSQATTTASEREHAPEEEPDQVRDREEEPEEDGEPRPLEAVGQLESNRVRGQRGVRHDPGRVGGRVAVGDEEQVADDLRRVADRVDDQVTQPAGVRPRATDANHASKAAVAASPPTDQPVDQPAPVSCEVTHEVFTNHDPPPTAAEDEHRNGEDDRAATRPRDWRVDGSISRSTG